MSRLVYAVSVRPIIRSASNYARDLRMRNTREAALPRRLSAATNEMPSKCTHIRNTVIHRTECGRVSGITPMPLVKLEAAKILLEGAIHHLQAACRHS
jgi:hypothetical protein